MKKLPRIMMALLLVLVFAAASTVHAEDVSVFPPQDLSTAQKKAMEDAGIPVYPNSIYTTGDDSAATVIWFQAMDPPEKIMDWYESKLSGWSTLIDRGIRVLYKGPKGIEAKKIYAGSHPYIFVSSKENSGEGNDIEITIFLPR